MLKFITNAQSRWITRDFKRDEEGAAMAEYGLLLAGIAVVVGAAALALGGRIRDLFDGIL